VFPSTGTPESEGGFCVVCGKSVAVEPTRPPGDATCPHCGSLVWFLPGFQPREFEVGECARLAVGGSFGPTGIVEAVDLASRRMRVGFYGGLQVITVDAPIAAFATAAGFMHSPPDPALPCSNCGSPAQFEPWDPPESQLCSVCHSPSAPKGTGRTPPFRTNDEVVLTAGVFLGSRAVIEAVHVVDGRMRLIVAGFRDAVVRVLAQLTEVVSSSGST